MSTKETYQEAILKISKLKPVSDTNKLLLAASSQMQDLVHRAASEKCLERRMNKLIWYWKTYKGKVT